MLIGWNGSSIGTINVSSHLGFSSLWTVFDLYNIRPPTLNFTYGSLVPLLSIATNPLPLINMTRNWKNECLRNSDSRLFCTSLICVTSLWDMEPLVPGRSFAICDCCRSSFEPVAVAVVNILKLSVFEV